MHLIPKKFKYNKQQKGKAFNKIIKCQELFLCSFGSYGLKALEHGRLNAKQIEAIYMFLNKQLKKKGKVFLKIFAHVPITAKPIEVRMGKGKGAVQFFIAKIKPGMILCEIETPSKAFALTILELVKSKIPLKTKVFSHNKF